LAVESEQQKSPGTTPEVQQMAEARNLASGYLKKGTGYFFNYPYKK
jgi:hypothetical protein